jgi:hypothetical protein
VADEEALFVVVSVDEPAGDTLSAVATDFSGVRVDGLGPPPPTFLGSPEGRDMPADPKIKFDWSFAPPHCLGSPSQVTASQRVNEDPGTSLGTSLIGVVGIVGDSRNEMSPFDTPP